MNPPPDSAAAPSSAPAVRKLHRKAWGVLPLLIVVAIIGVPRLRLGMYDEGYNAERKRLGIPLIEPGWEGDYSRSTGNVEFYGANVYGRGHVRKRVQVNYLSGIKRESDLFVFKGVTMDWGYAYGQADPWEIDYYYGKDYEDHTRLTYQQALDSLAVLKRRP